MNSWISKVFLMIIYGLWSSSLFSMEISNSKLEFQDYVEERDGDLIESIIKHDYASLISSSSGYRDGDGVQVFKRLYDSSRKILSVDNVGCGFAIYFIAHNNLQKHLQDGDGVLALMGVHHDHRRKGYGAELLSHVIDSFKAKNCTRVWLSVNEKNKAAQGLYSKFKFQNTQEKSWVGGQSYWWKLELKN